MSFSARCKDCAWRGGPASWWEVRGRREMLVGATPLPDVPALSFVDFPVACR